MNRSTRQYGFTLIELILVIVILGVLAAVAVPRFIDLSSEAEVASVRAQAGALTSASSMNFAAFKAGRGTGTDTNAAVLIAGDADQVCDNDTLNSLLASDVFPDDFTATVATDSGDCDDDAFVRCTITPSSSGAQGEEDTATIYCTK